MAVAEDLGDLERPSGKEAGAENFPVASFLIRRDLRRHVRAFYRFARAADDIADAPGLMPAGKLARLDLLEQALTTGAPALPAVAPLRESLRATGVADVHARELLQAFRQDATTTRWRDWAALTAYCRVSAAPVGRHVLALHGIGDAAWPASDALCAALQVLNHLQDCGEDHRALGRVYLPMDLVRAQGARVHDLAGAQLTPALRAVLDTVLDRVDALLVVARALPGQVRRGPRPDRRLAGECAAILAVAVRLSQRLRRGDPLAGRVRLSPIDRLVVMATGLGYALFSRGRSA
jgi:farnesyl-diphosphate farnesyltransferase